MTLARTLAVVAVALGPLVSAQDPVRADCAGPTIEHDAGTVDRDGTVRVVGTTWGDDCDDTGSPPPGESAIGKPVTGIEIVLVQGGVEHLVATGDADEEYGFVVDVPVPDDLAPGPIEVVARTEMNPSTHDATREQLVVSDRPPSGASDDAPVRFGESEPGPDPDPAGRGPAGRSPDDDDGGVPWALVGAGAVLLAAGVVGAAVRGTRRRRRR